MEHYEKLQPILKYYRRWKRLPSLRELAKMWGYSAHESARKLANQFIEHGYFIKDRKTGALLPGAKLLHVRILGSVQAGFPSPAEEELIDPLDLNELLIKYPDSTYGLRAQGNSMIGAGIFDGDLLLIKRTTTAKEGDIVIARVDGDGFTMKYLRKHAGKFYLEPANKNYKPIYPKQELKIDFVVLACIRQFNAS